MADISLLDQSVAKLIEAAKDLPPEDIEGLIAAEEVGKTRASAIAALEALLPEEDAEDAVEEAAPIEAQSVPNTVTNCLPGTTLHLGDGRRLAFDESADVPADVAAALRESGQAK